jgi:hypothetical protein
LVGCCGSGPTHKCDFTPPNQHLLDGGIDGQLPCGTTFCELPQVCCVKKAPLSATCIDLAQFEQLGCEKMDLPCLGPMDCPTGLACCLSIGEVLAVSCRPQQACGMDDMTYVVCEDNMDCPPGGNVNPCQLFTTLPTGEPFNICF